MANEQLYHLHLPLSLPPSLPSLSPLPLSSSPYLPPSSLPLSVGDTLQILTHTGANIDQSIAG